MTSNQQEAGDQKPVLSFYDSFLRTADLATLEKGCWLNDQIISFYMQYLEYNAFAQLQDDAAFLAAGVVQLMKLLSAQELQESFSFLAEKKLVFLPLNNCERGRGGGSHWSLMIYYDNVFYHMDSTSAWVQPDAKGIVEQLSQCVFKRKISLRSLPCPSQTNSSDCGMYVLEFTELACAAYADGKPLSEEVFKSITPANISNKRTALLNIIQELRTNSKYSHR